MKLHSRSVSNLHKLSETMTCADKELRKSKKKPKKLKKSGVERLNVLNVKRNKGKK